MPIGPAAKDFLSMYLEEQYLPWCALCERKVTSVKLIAGTFSVAQVTVRCHNQAWVETIADVTARNQEAMYRYLEEFKDRRFFIQEAEIARQKKRKMFDLATFDLAREFRQRISRNFAEQMDRRFTYADEADAPRSYQVGNIVTTNNTNDYYAGRSEYLEQIEAKPKAKPAPASDSRKRAIRLED